MNMNNKTAMMGVCAAAGALLPLAQACDKKPQKPNLIVIMTDQQRADALGIVGKYPFLQTPNLDRLARSGVHFVNAYTPCAVSGPARASLLTGLLVEHTGVLTNAFVSEDPVENHFTTLPTYAQLIARAGWRTEYHGEWHSPSMWLDCYEGLQWAPKKNRPFSFFMEEQRVYDQMLQDKYGNAPKVPGAMMEHTKKVQYMPDAIDRRVLRGTGPDGELTPEEAARRIQTQPDNHGMLLVDDEDSQTAYQGRLAVQAVRDMKDSDRPFFLTLSFNYPHSPMVPTAKYYNMYKREDMPVPASIGDTFTDSPYVSQNGRLQLPEYSDPELIKYMMTSYFGLVSEIDYWVGEILDALEEIGQTENTMVVFLSDHGEMLGDHGMREKNVFYEGSAKVPLIISYPAKIKPRTVTDNITTLDLFATLMDYMGIKEAKEVRRDSRSLRPLMEGRHRKEGDFTVTEWLYNGTRMPSHMIMKDGWKLFFNYSKDSKVPPVLFNLNEDPDEMHNLLGKSNPEREKYFAKAEELKAVMLGWLSERNSSYVDQIKEVEFK